MDFELDGRVAIITGCSVGIGREVAKVLAGEGTQTMIIARREALLKTLQEEVVAAGGPRPLAMALDVTDPKTPQAVVAETLAQFGRLDILVNNAGGSRPTAVDAPDEVWEESWTLNFTAVRRLTQACLPAMQTQRWGRIIHITGSSEPSGTTLAIFFVTYVAG